MMLINVDSINEFTKFDVLNMPLRGSADFYSYYFAAAKFDPSKNKIELTLKNNDNEEEKLGVICQKEIVCYDTSKIEGVFDFDSNFRADSSQKFMSDQKIVELQEIIIECSRIFEDKDKDESTHKDGISKQKKLNFC